MMSKINTNNSDHGLCVEVLHAIQDTALSYDTKQRKDIEFASTRLYNALRDFLTAANDKGRE